MKTMTWNQVTTAATVVMAAVGSVVVLINLINGIRGLMKPSRENAEKIQRHLATDKARIDAHEERLAGVVEEMAEIRDGYKVLCAGVQALLEHELHNGNADQMQKAANEINQWLINR